VVGKKERREGISPGNWRVVAPTLTLRRGRIGSGKGGGGGGKWQLALNDAEVIACWWGFFLVGEEGKKRESGRQGAGGNITALGEKNDGFLQKKGFSFYEGGGEFGGVWRGEAVRLEIGIKGEMLPFLTMAEVHLRGKGGKKPWPGLREKKGPDLFSSAQGKPPPPKKKEKKGALLWGMIGGGGWDFFLGHNRMGIDNASKKKKKKKSFDI